MIIIQNIKKSKVVNDLTTGGIDVALSAEQGKMLGDGKMNRLYSMNTPAVDMNLIISLIAIGFDFHNANLSSANLMDAYLEYANLSSANLSDAYLENINLSNANMTSANLTSASLTSANLSYANLSGAMFNSANLNSANLNSANLSNTYLSGANLTNANLTNAKLHQSDLSQATGLDANISIALAGINKNPKDDLNTWELTWTNGFIYICDPTTGLFTEF